MTQFLIRRIFWAIFLFFVATIITYLIFWVIPADPAQLAAGKSATPADIVGVPDSNTVVANVDFGFVTGNRAFVFQAYLDVLGRRVDADGLGFWSDTNADSAGRTHGHAA